MNYYDGRILLVSAVPPPVGGDATWAVEYIDFCKENYVDIDIVNTSISGKRAKSAEDRWNLFDEIKRCFRIWAGVFCKIRNNNPTIMHLNTNCSPKGVIRDYLCSLIARLFRVPYVLHCHCNISDQIGQSKLGLFFLARMMKNAKKVLVLNKNSLLYSNNYSCNSIIIPNSVSEDLIVEEKEIRNEVKKIIFTGHVKKTKGIDEICEVAKIFKEYEFIIVGPIAEEYSNDMDRFTTNVKLLGAVDNKKVYNLIDEADIFLFPSYTEGFSRSLLEAMARGIPCVATGVGANEDMLENKGGIIVNIKSVDSIVDALNILSDIEVRKAMSIWNIYKVKNEYTKNKVISALFEIYNEVNCEKNM